MSADLDLTIFPGLPAGVQDADVAIPSHVADLAKTFPLLFFMLAADIGPFSRRAEALRLVELGRPLSEVSTAYGMPLSLRRIGPQSCRTPLPWLAWSCEASAALGNHTPDDAAAAASWLAAVFYAAKNADERFALWIARQLRLAQMPQLDAALLRPLAVYAWHSLQPENPLCAITTTPWSPAHSLSRTIRETEAWLARLTFLVQSGEYPISDTWLAGGPSGGFDIVPITSLEELLSERQAMRNCLHTYAEKLASGACRLFAVRSGSASVGTLELVADRNGAINMSQLKGPRNAHPTPEIDAAVRAWFRSQQASRPPAAAFGPTSAQIASRLAQLLKPYLHATAGQQAQPTLSITSLRSAVERLRRLTSRTKQPAPPVRNLRLVPAGVPGVSVAAADASSMQARQVLAALRVRVGEDVFSAWFQTLQVHGLNQGTVQVSVPVRFIARWIETHYRVEMLACCNMVWPDATRVEVVVRPPELRRAPNVGPQPEMPARHHAQEDEPIWFRRRVRIDEILMLVSRHTGIARADLLSQRRHRSVVQARQVAMYLSYRLAGRSLPEIGRRLGGRDHTTVLHAIRKIHAMIGENAAFGAEIAGLEQTILATPPAPEAPLPHQPNAGA